MNARYLPHSWPGSRQTLPSRTPHPRGLLFYAMPPLVVGLCLTMPFVLAAPRIAAGLSEGEASGWE